MGVPAWALWSIAAAALAIGEVFTPGLFFLGPLAVAAVAAAVVAAASGSTGALLAFIVVSVLSIAVLRPLARRHLRMPVLSRTGTAALVGRKALVLEQVDGSGGRVKIGGEEWSARAFLEGEALRAGEQVEVAQIEGATALVLR
ncbi:MAG TPA: NfeD family protein [Gaiellaceae bacterium]|jgi:membrane protein implicated in regulation of membrane protease activity|nr:NfeD family protein [Sphingomicrobium sp.]